MTDRIVQAIAAAFPHAVASDSRVVVPAAYAGSAVEMRVLPYGDGYLLTDDGEIAVACCDPDDASQTDALDRIADECGVELDGPEAFVGCDESGAVEAARALLEYARCVRGL